MAVSAEVMGMHQKSGAQYREHSRRPYEESEPYREGTFLDTLNPLNPRPARDSLLYPINISVLQPSIYQVQAISYNPELLDKSPGSMVNSLHCEPVIFSAPSRRGNVIPLKHTTTVEAGRNDYLNRSDHRIYPGQLFRGSEEELPDLFKNLKHLSAKGKFPVHTIHSHPPSEIPLTSIHDLMIFYMRRQQWEDIPLVNAVSVLGNGVLTLGQRTAESPALLTVGEVKELDLQWSDYYDLVTERAKREWSRGSRSVRGTQKEREEFEQYLHSEQDRVVSQVADELELQFYLSTDMTTADPMSTIDIIQELRDRQRLAA